MLLWKLLCCLFLSGVFSPSTALTDDSSSYACPENWVYDEHGFCFYFGVESFTWVEAADFCNNIDGFLAEVWTEEESTFLTSMAVMMETMTGVNTWWLGLTDFNHEGRWKWSHSGLDATFTQWDVYSPDMTPYNKKDCVIMTSRGEFTWRDLPCYEDVLASPLCQRKSFHTPTTTYPTTMPHTTTTTPTTPTTPTTTPTTPTTTPTTTTTTTTTTT